ncbi:MAG: acyl-[ACP]--phospholipid O-acyltransferase [Methylococcaceae bacterium]|nr:MAG: acyl-[ACP]--phospholipid O-acyltransferase [Methylococcaceae bacterium]
MLKKCLRWVLKVIYRVEVKGLDNYHQAGKRVLIIANHTSFLDPLLLGVFLPDPVTFAINTHIAQRWWLKPFLRLAQVFPMDPTQPLSLKNLIHHLQNNDSKTVIFPEGRITATGSLMKIYDGTGMVADKANAIILPIRIDGAQYTHFSKLDRLLRLRWFPNITLHILPPTQFNANAHDAGKHRRKSTGHKLSDIMTEMMFATSNYQQNLFSALLEAKSIHGGGHVIAEDLERRPVSYNQLVIMSLVLGDLVKHSSQSGEIIGLMLPNSVKTLAVLLGLQLHGRVPAMLNYSTGSVSMISACQTAKITTIVTSSKFIELANLSAEAKVLSDHFNVIYLEELASSITFITKLSAFLRSKTMTFWYDEKAIKADSPAVVLFTSGSEGTPKGVVLSHRNILANHKQVAARISFTSQDIVLNFLPMFHSFGFTIGTLLPVLNGMKTFFYPTPLHFSVIPEIAYEISATIMFGTNTFFAAYGKKAHPYDFYSLRYVVAGAEKLQESTRQLWQDKFGIRLLEGYGATETAPVAAVNTPMDYKANTVGRLLPAMDYRLEAIEGIHDAGKLHVYGPNIMLGYLQANQPGQLKETSSIYGKGWYDTGDIAHIDDDGFVSIRGRSKRFAKVGGEMVSLMAVEQLAINMWPDSVHAAISLPDAKKGEQIILITSQQGATPATLAQANKGVSSILLPKKILITDSIPVMTTGKTDYPTLTAWVVQQL